MNCHSFTGYPSSNCDSIVLTVEASWLVKSITLVCLDGKQPRLILWGYLLLISSDLSQEYYKTAYRYLFVIGNWHCRICHVRFQEVHIDNVCLDWHMTLQIHGCYEAGVWVRQWGEHSWLPHLQHHQVTRRGLQQCKFIYFLFIILFTYSFLFITLKNKLFQIPTIPLLLL